MWEGLYSYLRESDFWEGSQHGENTALHFLSILKRQSILCLPYEKKEEHSSYSTETVSQIRFQ